MRSPSPTAARSAAGWAANECKAAAFVEVTRVARAHGIPVLPVKGVLTSRLLYDQPAERPMVDVDVRVRAGDLGPLCAAAHAAGWRQLERWRSYASAAFDVGGERVEIETHVGPPGTCRITTAAMIARATEHVAPFGTPHLQPELHDHALVLVVNAFKDKLAFASNGGLTDLERIADGPGFSFDHLADLAREGAVTSIAWLLAEWMVRERGAAGWSALHVALGSRAPRPVYARAFKALLRRDRPPSLPLRVLVRAAPDTVGMQARTLSFTAAWALETGAISPRFALARLMGRG